MSKVNGALELFAVLIIVMLLASTMGEKQKQGFHKFLTKSMLCHIAVLVLDAAQWFILDTDLIYKTEFLIILIILPMVIALIGNAFFIFSLLEYVSDRIRIMSKMMTVLALLFSVSVISWTYFVITNSEIYIIELRSGQSSTAYNNFYWLSQLSWTAICMLGIIIILFNNNKLKRVELWSFLSYCIFPVLSLLTEIFWNGSQVYLSTTLSLVLINSVLYIEQKSRLKEKEAQLAQSRIALMINQIQPHFLFNTLSSICSLCDNNPSEAKRITGEFAEYLRHNVDAINQDKPVDFETELKHVDAYLSIEKKRYENRLIVKYDIKTTNFFLPALTVQPLIENAVKHGISKKEQSGTVILYTYEEASYYCIEISDNGIGFDTEKDYENSSIHTGIENVKYRLSAMCNGTLNIQSMPGVGTKVIVKLPKLRKD